MYFVQCIQMMEEKGKSVKMKMGLFFGYNGESFQGMQYQREHTNTIENVLHEVLVKEGFILQSNASELKKIKWSRGARTDKKVHALLNGLSLKLEISPEYILNSGLHYNKLIHAINQHLPMDIRILAAKRVAKHFDMRVNASTRIYNYIIPSILFQPFNHFQQRRPVEQQQLKQVLDRLNDLVKFYLGTHNYYNFTRGYKQNEPQCERYMIKMHAQMVEESTVEGLIKENMEKTQQEGKYQSFIRFTLVGQSFIYHQIRKMVGLLVKIFSEELEGQPTIKKAFQPAPYEVYLAPGEGLYLNTLTFQGYNNKKDIREKLQFTEEEKEGIIHYRAYLESKILNHEIQGNVFTNWLEKRAQYRQEGQKEEQMEKEEIQKDE